MTDVRITVLPDRGGEPHYLYTDVDGDRLAMYPARLPDGRTGVNFRASTTGCTIVAEDIEGFISAVREVSSRGIQSRADRYCLTYGHDELNLWCQDCATEETSVETWFGGPTSAREIEQAMAEHEAESHAAEPGGGDA